MPLIRTDKQKDNLAKFLYDIAKLVLATAVVAPMVNLSVFSYVVMIGGIIVAAFLFGVAFILDGKEAQL